MKTIFTCLFFSVALFVSAQNTFKVRAFAPNYSFVQQVVQLNNGSFVSVGGIYQNPNTANIDLYILKTDATGKVLASKAISNDFESYSFSLCKTSDGGFAVCAFLNYQVGLIKYTANLTQQWAKQYTVTGSSSSSAYKVLQTPDGGFLLTGSVNDVTNDGSRDGYLLKTDGNGNVAFSKQYLAAGKNEIRDIAITHNGNYALLAVSDTDDEEGYYSAKIIMANTAGDVLWSKEISDNNLSVYPSAIAASSDGGVLIAGEVYNSNSNTAVFDRFLMMKYDASGTSVWSKTAVVPGYSESYAYSVTEDKDGGYIFAGNIDIFLDADYSEYDTSYAYLVKTNAAGTLQWTKTIEPTREGYTGIGSFITTSDGGYAIAGEGFFYNADDEDYNDGSYIYKLNSNLEVCGEVDGSKGTLEDYNGGASINTTSSLVTTTATNLTISLSDAGTTDNVCSGVLPLQLLSFNASLQNKSVAINWTTANEVNTNYFVVERSRDAVTFNALQQVSAKGNTATTQSYNTSDLQPLPGTSYYRLKEVDKDGKITYSSIVTVTVLDNGLIVISPNPVQNTARVIIQSAANTSATFQVMDMKGRGIITQKTSVVTGRNVINIPASSLSKGVYILKVIQNNTTQTIRFVKE